MLADAKRGKKRSSNCKIAGVSKTRSRSGSWIGVYLFKKRMLFQGQGQRQLGLVSTLTLTLALTQRRPRPRVLQTFQDSISVFLVPLILCTTVCKMQHGYYNILSAMKFNLMRAKIESLFIRIYASLNFQAFSWLAGRRNECNGITLRQRKF